MSKLCTRCQTQKPLYAFTKDRNRADGLFPWCSECKSCSRKEAYLLAHPGRREKVAAMTAPDGVMVHKNKLCIDCLVEKPVSHFHRKRSAADGRCSYCKPCSIARSARWQAANRERGASRRLAWRQASPRPSLNVSLRGALSRRPTENPITLDELMGVWTRQGGKCAVSGIAMTWARGKILSTSITLDRIDPAQGYCAGNVRLLCHAVNSFRGRMSDDEMYEMALAIVANMKRPKLRLVG